MTILRRSLLPAAVFLSMTMGIPEVLGHAAPVRYEPASASVLPAFPPEASIRFSERVDIAGSRMRILGPDGSEVTDGMPFVDREDPRLFRAGLRPSGSGTYTVSWQVLSADDGHFTKGAYVFSVGNGSGAGAQDAGQFQIQHRSGWPEALLIFLELFGQGLLLGIFALTLTAGRSMTREGLSPAARALLIRRLRMLLGCAAGLLLAGTLGYMALKSTALGSDRGVPVPEAMGSFLASVAGRSAICRMILGLAVTGLLCKGMPVLLIGSRKRLQEAILVALIAGTALLRARVSHAAASEFLPALSILLNAAHLLFKDLWIGGLAAFLFAFLPAVRKSGDARQTVLPLLTFSNLLMLALAVGGTTGAYIVWLHLQSPANLLSTHWGGYLLALGAFGVTLFILRVWSQRLIHPSLVAIAEGKANAQDREHARVFRPLLITEFLAGLAALLFSSILIITTPPLPQPERFERTTVTPQAAITLEAHPWEQDQLLVTVERPQSAGTGGVLTVTVENPGQSLGPIDLPAQKRFPGGFVFPTSALAAAGTWTVRVSEQSPPLYDAVATFTVHAPDDLAVTESGRTLDGFALTFVIIGIAVTGAAWMLARQNGTLRARLARGGDARITLPEFRHAWLAWPVGLLIVVTIGLAMGTHGRHGNTGFAKLCRLYGGYWHENVPMRDGVPTSDISVLGCMIGMGRGTFHFADPREFSWFVRRESPHAALTTEPATLVPGVPALLTFRITDDAGKPVTDLTFEHDRILHAVIVSQDLQTFAHAHVEDTGPVTPGMLTAATFPVRYTFPGPGRYLIALDYTVRSQTLAQQFFVTVGTPPPADIPEETGLVQTGDGMTVELTPPRRLASGTVQKLVYRFTNADGTPVTDLQPYLAAPMHMSVVKTDLQAFLHVHAELPQNLWDSIFTPRDPNAKHIHQFLPDQFGPELAAYVLFPTPGQYEIFGEVRRNGKTVLTRFRLSVE